MNKWEQRKKDGGGQESEKGDHRKNNCFKLVRKANYFFLCIQIPSNPLYIIDKLFIILEQR